MSIINLIIDYVCLAAVLAIGISALIVGACLLADTPLEKST